MPTADMNRLMDHIKIRLPGVLDGAAQMEMFSALNEFFQITNIWYEDIQFTVTPTNTTYFEDPDAHTYEIIPNLGTITRLLGVADSSGIPVAASMPVLGELIIGVAPSATETYTARVALTVTDPITRDGYPQFPDWIMKKYGTGIIDGILGRLMGQIAKPYSSPNIAIMHLRKFRSLMSSAKTEAIRQNVYGAQSWKYPQSYATSRRQKL